MQKYGKITGWWVYCVLCFGVATVFKNTRIPVFPYHETVAEFIDP